MDAVISGIVGLLSGAVGSLVAPCVNWGIEKRRNTLEYRRDQIKRWRQALGGFGGNDFVPFLDSVAYSELRPHLDPELVHSIEHGRTFFVAPEGRPGPHEKHMLLDAIAEIERKWELI